MLTLFKNISLKDKVLFYESIANLLEGGVTLLAALKGFSSRVPPGNFKEAIENTIFFVEWGDTMNVAMRKVPNFYTQKEIAIVEAGEQTGMLRTTFTAISDELRTEEDLRRKVTSAMIYPFIIVFFLILALIVVMVYVIPQIIPIISETGSELSWSTRSLIFASDFFRDNFILIIALIVSAGFIFRGYITTPSGRKWIDREKLFFPVIGRVYRSYMIVQVMETFHLLTASWVSIVTTLHLTGWSSGNRVIEEMYERMSADISHGKKIFESMQSVDKAWLFFSSDILQMIESAERTSTIKEVSLKISQQYRREVDAALANMVKFIEPLALLFSGTFVLWFAIAIFSAIMQVVSVAGV
jgi:type II secretory pathway component PulF